MGPADFLLSPTAQQLLQLVLADPARQFATADLAKLCKLDMALLEQTLAPLLDCGVLSRGEEREGQPETFAVNTAFVLYPELRRIALKSFAAADPLRAMLQSRFRASVQQAFLLGEDPDSRTLDLLLVYAETAPEREALDTALRKLLKSGALRQHVQADVVPARRFETLKRSGALAARLAADSCVDISPTPPKKPRPQAAPEPMGLLQRARRRLGGFGG